MSTPPLLVGEKDIFEWRKAGGAVLGAAKSIFKRNAGPVATPDSQAFGEGHKGLESLCSRSRSRLFLP